MIGNPLNVKFTNEFLNKPIQNPLKIDKTQCKDHENLEHIEFRDNEIFCKTCKSKLKLVPAWIIG